MKILTLAFAVAVHANAVRLNSQTETKLETGNIWHTLDKMFNDQKMQKYIKSHDAISDSRGALCDDAVNCTVSIETLEHNEVQSSQNLQLALAQV